MQHLNDEQVDEYLIGDLAPELAAHLSTCELCLARVAEAEAPIAAFRSMSLAWSERRSATLPTPVSEATRRGFRFAPVHWLAGATGLVTAALVMIFALPAHSHDAAPAQTAGTQAIKSAPVVAPAPVPQPAPQPETLAALGHTGITSITPVAASPEQIERDNQMLADIKDELEAPRDADSLGLVAAARTPAR